MPDTLVVGGTYRFQATFYENDGDEEPMDLTGATVTLRLRKPDGTTLTRTATVLDPASDGVARYDCVTTDITVEGEWRRSWKVVQGSVELPSVPVEFPVVPSP